MEKIKIFFWRLIGLAFLGMGIFVIISSFQEEDFLVIFLMGLLMTGMGFLFARYSKQIVNAEIEEKKQNKPNKYVIRQVILFLILMMGYFFFCIYLLDKYSKVNKDIKTLLMVEGIGFVGIFIGFCILMYNAVKQRKNNKIHDWAFSKNSIHKNNNIFTMIIDCCWFEDGKTYMRGNVHGKVEKSDEVYIYYPLDKAYSSKIEDIQKEGISRDCMEEERCTLVIKTDHPVSFPNYTLCTSIIPFGNKNLERNIDNPEIVGLLNAYQEQIKNDGYFGALIYEIVHGKYLVRALPIKEYDNVFTKIHNFFFGHQGNYSIDLVENEQGEGALPIYTDWQAVNDSLKEVKEEYIKQRQAMVLSFDEIQKVANNMNQSIVINPFSSSSYHLSRELINAIINSEDYQKEFDQAKKESK